MVCSAVSVNDDIPVSSPSRARATAAVAFADGVAPSCRSFIRAIRSSASLPYVKNPPASLSQNKSTSEVAVSDARPAHERLPVASPRRVNASVNHA